MRKGDAVTTFKTCPKCKGTGQVTCDGRDHIRLKYLTWAWKYHMKPVVYCAKAVKTSVPGIAVAGINPGGWAFLDIYVSRAGERARAGEWSAEIGDYLYVRRRRKRGTKMEYENFYVVECRGPEMDKVRPLEIWPQDLMLLTTGYELDDGESLKLAEVSDIK